MATLEQIGAALKKADAAGNVDDARKLAAAYRAMQQGDDKPPVIDPMGAGLGQGFTMGWGDEIYAGATAPIRALPGLFNGEGYDVGKAYDEGLAMVRDTNQRAAEENPVAYNIGEVGGALSLGGPTKKAAATALAATRPTIKSLALRGAAEGAGYGAVSGAGRAEGDMGDRMRGATEGAVEGAVTGGVLGGTAGAIASRQAAKGVPSLADLKLGAKDKYTAARQSGVQAQRPDTIRLSDQMFQVAVDEGLVSPTGRLSSSYPKINEALRTFDDYAAGGTMTVPQMQAVRKTLRGAAKSSDAEERRLASIMLEKFNEFTSGLAPALREGDELYSRAMKGKTIEKLFQKAEDAVGANYNAAGFETALRQQFKSLLSNEKALRGFTEEEVAAIRAVVRGGPIGNVLRWMGRYSMGSPFSAGVTATGPAVVGTLLSGGNPLVGAGAAVAAMGAGQAARMGATAATKAGARKVSEMVRRGSQPVKAIPSKTQALIEALISTAGNEAARLNLLPSAIPQGR